jgi:hypothetical protein
LGKVRQDEKRGELYVYARLRDCCALVGTFDDPRAAMRLLAALRDKHANPADFFYVHEPLKRPLVDWSVLRPALDLGETERGALLDEIRLTAITRLPPGKANAPPITKIRQAVRHGAEISFTRGRSGRTVTFRAR